MIVADQDTGGRLVRRQRNFVAKHLGAKFPVSKAFQLTDYDFTEQFSPGLLKQLGKDTDAGIQNRGRGSFDKPYKLAVELQEGLAALKAGKYKGDTIKEGRKLVDMRQVAEKLIKESQEWVADRKKDVQKSGKDLGDRAEAKMTFCEDFAKGAKLAMKQLELWDDLHNPQSDVNALFHEMKAVEVLMRRDGPLPALVDQYRSLDAKILAQTCGVTAADSGTSDVSLIRGPDGGVAYAFKSARGESVQMGSPKGGGALREVLASKIFEEINNQFPEFNFPWPKCSLMSLPDKKGIPQVGCLIDGLAGKPADEIDIEVRNRIPPEEIHKYVVCSMAVGQLDTKWDGVFVEEVNGQIKLNPYDGGAIAPSTFMLVPQADRGVMIGAAMLAGPPMTPQQTNATLPPELCAVFRKLDTDAIKRVMKDELTRNSDKLDPDALGVTEGAAVTLAAMEALKQVLMQGGNLTLDQLIQAFHTQVTEPLANQMRPGVEQAVFQQYANLKAVSGNLLPDVSNRKYGAVLGTFLDPAPLALLNKIIELGQQVDLTQLGLKMPIVSPKAAAVELRKLNPPDQIKAAFPEFFSDNYNQYNAMRDQAKKVFPQEGASLDYEKLYDDFLNPAAQAQIQKLLQIHADAPLDVAGLTLPITSAADAIKRVKQLNLPDKVKKKHPDIFPTK